MVLVLTWSSFLSTLGVDMGGQISRDALSVFRSASSESFKEKAQLL